MGAQRVEVMVCVRRGDREKGRCTHQNMSDSFVMTTWLRFHTFNRVLCLQMVPDFSTLACRCAGTRMSTEARDGWPRAHQVSEHASCHTAVIMILHTRSGARFALHHARALVSRREPSPPVLRQGCNALLFPERGDASLLASIPATCRQTYAHHP